MLELNRSAPRVGDTSIAAADPIAFTLLRPESGMGADARFDESLLALAAARGPVASIWQTQRSLVVPRSYRRFDAFESACAQFAAQGWPLTVRQTGGGIVPQGPGIVNFSLAYRVQGPPMRHSEPGYRLICRALSQAMHGLGVTAFPAAVEGSFCDGRYNLAVRLHGRPVKVAGTAQTWRRVPGSQDEHVGLVHALVLLDVDTGEVTATANAFEAAIGSERRYQPDKVVAVAELLDATDGLHACFQQLLEQAVAALRWSPAD